MVCNASQLTRSPRPSRPSQCDTPPITQRHSAENRKNFTCTFKTTLSKYKKWQTHIHTRTTHKNETPTVIPLSINTVFHNPPDIGHVESTCNHEAKELLKAALSTGKLLIYSGKGGIVSHLQAVMSLGYCHCCVNEASHHL